MSAPKKELTLDSTVKEKIDALRAVAEHADSDLTHLVGRDDHGNLLFVGVYARGEEAARLLRWLNRRTES